MNSSATLISFDRKYDIDDLWSLIYSEAEAAVVNDHTMSGFLYPSVLNHQSLRTAVINRLVDRLYHYDLDQDVLRQTLTEAAATIENFDEMLSEDIAAVFDLDPACHRLMDALLYFKGFHALQTYRLANALWQAGRIDFSYYLQSRSSSVFQTDIHPAATIGKGIFLDHATGLVIGETAVVEDHVSILHSVTLGGTGKAGGDRHPKIRHGVLIGAGAKILGNIEVGHCSKIASGSVVLKDVPAGVTVAGVPARIIGEAGCTEPARNMDQTLIAGDGI
ncbi:MULTISPECIES: serine O-acetyltransferase [unclassified Bartonella]|uniref:serine O-acetyltransferase n=1 Tax=unclassified Bartonella TaxID=2645622 RepID=UPI0015FA07F8|nr:MULTISPECIES: serine O-acetyltransferase [unclassified Bartonella]UXN07474.1 serine O-acetyltransferase [Bartonella sp. HY761]